MDKFTFKTADGIDVNLEKLSRAFPEVITETVGEDGKIKRVADFEKLKMLLGDSAAERPQEFYEFTWPGKNEAIFETAKATTKTLRPCPEESKNWDTTQNLYIEGDNLEALKILQESYLGKVKMIYIDPPYNTGKDFVYRDNFHKSAEEGKEDETVRDEETDNNLFQNTESNGRFHSDWCSMIYPRLKLARDLLRDDGVIFISIDDNEVHNLRKICDEIFGVENFRGCITVVGNPRGRDYGGIARMHDYLMVYSKSNNAEINNIKDEEKKFPFYDELGGFELRELRNRNIVFNSHNRPNLYYPFYIDPTTADENDLYEIYLSQNKQNTLIELYPKESQGVRTVWRWGKPKSLENLNFSIKAKKMKDEGWQIVEKYREKSFMARSVWNEKIVNTERGTLLVKEMFETKIFDFPKPVEMLCQILEMGSNTDSIILDFFSGSATTAHACMQLNAEDGGNRKFIMVQLPEVCAPDSEAAKAGYKNICEIGKERIRRAGEKIKAEHATTAPDLDIGFRVLKIDESIMKDVFYSPNETSQDLLSTLESNIKEDRTDLDLLFACLVDWGVELSMPLKTESIDGIKIHTMSDSDTPALIACFAQNIPETVVRKIAARHPLRTVFRDSSFADSPAKINLTEIFKTYSPETEIKVL